MIRKKILLIIPELCVGGAQRSICKLSEALSKHAEILLVVFNRDIQPAYKYSGQLLSLDVQSGRSVIKKVVAFLTRIYRLKAIKSKHNVDVAISFLEGADYINILSKGKEHVVISLRGSKLYDETMKEKFFWLRRKVLIPFLYKRVSKIVAVNQGIRRELTDFFGIAPSRITVIPNFYDVEGIQEFANEDRPPQLATFYTNPVLVTTGRLAPEKGLNGLLDTFVELKKRIPNLRWVVVGDGPERGSLELKCVDNNLQTSSTLTIHNSPDVLFTGFQNNIFMFLKGASVYMMNSSSEGFPNGLLEAMACEVPVVAADCPYGPREILDPEFDGQMPVRTKREGNYGILMPVISSSQHINEWVESLYEIISDKEKQRSIAKRALHRVRDFDTQKIVTQWLFLWQ